MFTAPVRLKNFHASGAINYDWTSPPAEPLESLKLNIVVLCVQIDANFHGYCANRFRVTPRNAFEGVPRYLNRAVLLQTSRALRGATRVRGGLADPFQFGSVGRY